MLVAWHSVCGIVHMNERLRFLTLLALAGRRAVSVLVPLVWNLLTDCLCDSQIICALASYLFACCLAQCIERIKDSMTVCFINLLHTYLLIMSWTTTYQGSLCSHSCHTLELEVSLQFCRFSYPFYSFHFVFRKIVNYMHCCVSTVAFYELSCNL